MKTIQNINPEHLAKLKDLLDQTKPLVNWDELYYIDILPWLRTITPGDHENPYIDQIITNGIANDIHLTHPYIKTISTQYHDSNNDPAYIGDWEADIVQFEIRFQTESQPELINPFTKVGLETVFTLLQAIMLHDCTGCCNAIRYITLSRDGIYAIADTARTYHS